MNLVIQSKVTQLHKTASRTLFIIFFALIVAVIGLIIGIIVQVRRLNDEPADSASEPKQSEDKQKLVKPDAPQQLPQETIPTLPSYTEGDTDDSRI